MAKLTFLWYDNLGEKRVSAEEWHGFHSKNALKFQADKLFDKNKAKKLV